MHAISRREALSFNTNDKPHFIYFGKDPTRIFREDVALAFKDIILKDVYTSE
jgi:hypothetical protein